MAAVPLFLEFSAIREASEAVTFSGSMRVMWIEPSVFIFSSKYLSIGPSISNPSITLFLRLLQVFFFG